jgi:hypothetical protein
MKKKFKKWQKLIVLVSFFVLGAISMISLAFAATTISVTQVPASGITANANDFLVLDFNINVDDEETLAGTAPDAGTAITGTKPGDWVTVKFNDASSGGAWNSGTDWIGTSDSELNYYQKAATILGCPEGNNPPAYYARTREMCEAVNGSATPNGTMGLENGSLKYINDSDYLCANSFTNPTVIYRANSSSCATLASDCTEGSENLCYIMGSFPAGGSWVSNTVAQEYGWVFHDTTGGGLYSHVTENLFLLPAAYRNHIDIPAIFYEDSVTLAGIAPSATMWNGSQWVVKTLSNTRPTDWATVTFYDKHPGADWAPSNDWIGLDANEDGIYLDRLQTLTVNLHEDSTVSPANVSNVKFYAASGTYLGTVTSYDGGGSGWYLDGIDRALSAGSNRIYATMSLSGTSHGQTVRATVPLKDLNSNGSFDLGDAGVFLSSRVLGSFGNAAFMTVDSLPPTLTITMDENEFEIGDTALVTFEFSEKIQSFTTGNINVNNGSLSGLAIADDITWTATFTPSTNAESLSNTISVNMANITDIAGNSGSGTVHSPNYMVDTKRPTLSSAVFSDDKLKIGDTSTVTFTFSEPVSHFTNDALTVPNGELTTVSSSDGGTVWTATFTPATSTEVLGNVIVVDLSEIRDKRLPNKYNLGSGTTNSSSYDIDTVRPTFVSAVFSDDKLKIGDTATATFTFSEEVLFDNTALTIPNATLSAVGTTDGGLTWTATLTPDSDIEELTNIISLDMTQVKDVRLGTDWNFGEGTATSSNYEIDTIRPSLESIVLSDYKIKIGDTSIVTFTFSEPVSHFTNDALTIPNGELTTVSSSDGGTVWTAVLSPDDNIEDLTNIIIVDLSAVRDKKLVDDYNTGSGTFNSFNYEIDTIRPTLISATFSDDKLKIGDTATATFTFSEEVFFTNDALTIPNATLSAVETADDGFTWTATLTPNSDVEELINAITFDMTQIKDLRLGTDWNFGTGTATSSNYEIDTVRPTLISATFSDDKLKIGDTATATFTFSEEVFFTNDALTIPNATLSAVETADDGLTWTATLTPDSDIEELTNAITFDMTQIKDLRLGTDWNFGTGTATSSNYEIDTVRPTLISAVFSDDKLKIGDTATATFTFSEKVLFDNTALTIPNATLSAVETADDGLTWTAVLTPNSDIEELTNAITFDMTQIKDLRLGTDWNFGLGTATSSNYEIDTVRPTLISATFSDDKLKIGDTATATFTFSEEVLFDNTALTIPNATLSAVETADEGLTWTATLTPNSDVEVLVNAISFDMTQIKDLRLGTDWNFGLGTSTSSNYEIDTIRPTLISATFSDDKLKIGDTATATFTFSEEVFFTNDALTIPNATLSSVETADDGLTWTAVLTPDSDIEELTNAITFDMTQIKDVRLDTDWNFSLGTSTSSNYEIDTINPSFEIQYYEDSALSVEIDGDSYLGLGTYYIKITAREELLSAPTISLNAEGTANDVVNGATTHISGNNVYRYTRVIVNDQASIGATLESVTITGADEFGNLVENVNPTNEGAKAVYIDTVAPIVDAGLNRGTVSSQFIQTAQATDSGSGIASYLWTKRSGHYNVTFGTPNLASTTISVIGGGLYEIMVTVTDNVGNSASDTFTFTWGSVPRSGSSSGGAHTIYCSSVEYGPWGACVGTVQTRQVINRSPSGCALTTSQQLASTRDCVVENDKDEEEVVDGDDPVEEVEDGDDEVVVPPDLGKSGGELKREVLRRERQEQSEVNLGLVERLNGRILLQVEEKGESWYVEPLDERRYFMGRPADAFAMMRRFGLGISEVNYNSFLENGVPNRFSGRILIRVEENGEAYYINPVDMEMHYLGRPDDAFRIMRELGLGITNENLRQIPLGLSELDLVCLIDNDLSLGMSSIEVLDLQRYLNIANFPVALSGVGSKGRETNLFGSLTEEALKRYQANYSLSETGVFDEATRSSLVCN